ncbi:hypothetical protein CTAYLR_004013 [Chrysophaeum taylorii]|uniref:Phosphoesterase n=1 Tax=Chrysophaeum taylorii TaxID=2483200 RepID=A0AAD7U8I3_9STRA|nr:hypothetical protein CTAYLR_004013 [Chrysophaeum taylorii]
MLRLLLLIALTTTTTTTRGGDSDLLEEYTAEFLEMGRRGAFGRVEPIYPTPPRQNLIDHFVVLFMENHPAENMFACMDLPGFDSNNFVPYDEAYPDFGINITCGADYACDSAPNYDKFFSKFEAKDMLRAYEYPYANQSDLYSFIHGLRKNSTAVRLFSREQLPVKAAVADSFGVFNKLFTAVPGPSSPNHLFAQSGTSCGMRDNQLYSDCGGQNVSFPQKTIYDSMREHNVSFAFFLNSTCGLDGTPCEGEDPITDDSASAINTPDVAMEGVARYVEAFESQTVFYERAANGTLPEFSWINPPLQACDHPCYDVAKGERLLKDVYEALRSGPKWNETLFLVAYDDAGGFYDSVVPPYEGVPADDAPCNLQGRCGEQLPFDFRRLGLRSAAMLISPLVNHSIIQEPRQGPSNTSQFELTSIPATIKNLFNLSSFLTKRDAWAGSFHELLNANPRTDTPLHLPDAPDPQAPWDPPPAAAPTTPGHCSSWDGASEESKCNFDEPSLKQRRNLRLFSKLTQTPEPDVDAMSRSEADTWLAARWQDWLRSQNPVVDFL